MRRKKKKITDRFIFTLRKYKKNKISNEQIREIY